VIRNPGLCSMSISCLSKNCSDQISYSLEHAEWTIPEQVIRNLPYDYTNFIYEADYSCPTLELLVRREVKTFGFQVYPKFVRNPGIYIFLETKYMYAYYREYFGRF
jgi:hypothetical protein